MNTNTEAFLNNAIETALEKARKDIDAKIKYKAALDLSVAFTGLIAAGIVDVETVKKAMDQYGLTLTYNPSVFEQSIDNESITPSRPSKSYTRSSC